MLLITIVLPLPAWEEKPSEDVFKITLTEQTPLYKDRIKWVQPFGFLNPQEVIAEVHTPGWYLIQTKTGTAWIQEHSSISEKRKNVARGKPYTIKTPYLLDEHFEKIAKPYSQNMYSGLTDGKYGGSDYHSPDFIGMFSLGSRLITVDLEQLTDIREISLNILHDSSSGIYVPRQVQIWISADNEAWLDMGKWAYSLPPTTKKTLSQRLITGHIASKVRYVKIWVEMTGNSLFLDEVEIWGPAWNEAQDTRREQRDNLDLGSHRPFPEANRSGHFPSAFWFRNQVLIYTGFSKQNPLQPLTFTEEDFKPYVSYIDNQGKRVEWMFDSYLFLPYANLWDEAGFHSGSEKPTVKYHWEYFLDRLFRDGHELQALESAVEKAKMEIKDDGYQAAVVIGIPFPPTDQSRFGDIDGDGISENLHVDSMGEEKALQNRKKVVAWFVEEAMRRWEAKGFKHIQLIGFYWYNETLAEEKSVLDKELIRWTAKMIHERGLIFEWIPYFFSNGWSDWMDMGFDIAILQPNYMFHPQAAESRLDIAAEAARDHGLGLEIEMKDEILYDHRWRERYYAYLSKFKKFGYMNRSYQVFYQELKTLLKASQSSDPAVREIYDNTYRYLKGGFKKSGP